LYKAKDGVDYI
jgi:hypothetical protein